MNFEQGMLLCCYWETALSSLTRACFRSSSDILNVRMSVRLGHDWWWGGVGGGSVGGAEGLRWAAMGWRSPTTYARRANAAT